jgi:signal transduction histidine kinase/DNA-binding response OmpR family regulator
LKDTVVVDDLPAAFAPLPGGAWPDPTTAAILAPLTTGASEGPAGVLIIGASPRRAVDDEYRQFVLRAASHISAALTTVTAYQLERTRAEALAQLDRAKTVFFSNVSHEFRTPLTLMLGPIEDALGSPSKALTGVDLDATHRNAVRLLRLVNTLLDVARIESGRTPAAFQPIDLAALTRDYASTFRAAVERAGLGFVVDCPTLRSPLYVDPSMWEKVVLNLLSNALKFTFDGEIRVTLRESDDVVELTVADTGVGIPDEELPRLFERFHRVENTRARTHEGSGIGLALVHDLVQLHGGSIDVESRLGEGTRFTVTLRSGVDHLPADRVVAAAAAVSDTAAAQAFVAEAMGWVSDEAATLRNADVADSTGEHCHVLVADDNADLRDYIMRLLSGMCVVTAVKDGEEALAALRARSFDLLVTDVMMPGLDGFELVRRIRSEPSLKSTQVIMLSARAGEESRVEGLEHGADDYLVKPFAARELVAKVASRLGQANARRQMLAERDRLRELLSQVPAIVNFLSGPDLMIEFAHPLAVKAAGGRQLEGKTLLEAFPEFRGQPFAETIHRVFRTGEAVSVQEGHVPMDRTNSGRIEDTYWNSMYLPVRTESGTVEGVMTFDIEVTEQVLARRRLEEQTAALTRAHETAESANRVKDEFLAMLGHELRNPLSPIATAVQLMRLRGAEFRELAVIERQVGHLTRLVDDLLDVSRITRGKIALNRVPTEICEAVARAVEIASPLLEQRRHRLNLDVPTKGLVVYGDRERLAQVLSNLLTNAAKYSNLESPILVTARSIGTRVELRVKDVGIGIEAPMLGLVFDAFVQEGQAIDRARGGLGLGLTIARTLVTMHDGTIRAESAGAGYGSEFIVELPMSATPAQSEESVVAHATEVMPSQGLRVLVVDDNTDAAELLTQTLQHLGYELAIAHDGPSALERARHFQPDVAVLDIGLPVMDGYELAERLKNINTGSAPTLVAVTGYGQDADRNRTAAAGFAHHLVKPVNIQQLTDLLDRLSPAQ